MAGSPPMCGPFRLPFQRLARRPTDTPSMDRTTSHHPPHFVRLFPSSSSSSSSSFQCAPPPPPPPPTKGGEGDGATRHSNTARGGVRGRDWSIQSRPHLRRTLQIRSFFHLPSHVASRTRNHDAPVLRSLSLLSPFVFRCFLSLSPLARCSLCAPASHLFALPAITTYKMYPSPSPPQTPYPHRLRLSSSK